MEFTVVCTLYIGADYPNTCIIFCYLIAFPLRRIFSVFELQFLGGEA